MEELLYGPVYECIDVRPAYSNSRRAKGGHGQGFEILILSPDFDFGCLSPRTVAFKKLKFE